MSKYKIVSLDLDGTLLDSKKRISEGAKDFLINFQSVGGYVVLSSGRKINEIMPYAKELCLDNYNHGYIISCSGCYLWNMANMEVKEFDTLTGEHAYAIVKQLSSQKKDCLYTIVMPEMDYYVNGGNVLINGLKNLILKFKGKHQKFLSLASLGKIRGKVEKVMALTTDIGFINNSLSGFDYIKSNIIDKNRVEIFQKNIDKSSAISFLLQELQLNSKELLLFGDDENDLLCFDTFDNCVAMGNAIDQVKERSTFVTTTNDEDGVYNYLIKNIQL